MSAATNDGDLLTALDSVKQQLHAVTKIKDQHAADLEAARQTIHTMDKQIVNLREECTRLYAIETRLTRRVKWALARIEDLLLKGDA